jgi:hypothetical protein
MTAKAKAMLFEMMDRSRKELGGNWQDDGGGKYGTHGGGKVCEALWVDVFSW